MWPFRRRAWLPPVATGPSSFGDDWSASEIDYVSAAIRSNGQPDSEDFRRFARVALNTLRGGGAVELVARAMEESTNPGRDPDRPIEGSHYMRGMAHWCVWVEYARPAVAAIMNRARKLDVRLQADRADNLGERVDADRLARAINGDIRIPVTDEQIARAQAIIDHLGYLYRLRSETA